MLTLVQIVQGAPLQPRLFGLKQQSWAHVDLERRP